MIPKPAGLAGLYRAFGDPIPFADRKDEWEARVLAVRPLPLPLPYAYGGVPIVRVRAHREVVEHLVDTLTACLAAGVPRERLHYGGCYSWRTKRTSGTALSTHTWGVAVDLEPAANPMGRHWADDGKMLHPKIVETFLDMGWTWGEQFPTPDPQHLQWVDSY